MLKGISDLLRSAEGTANPIEPESIVPLYIQQQNIF